MKTCNALCKKCSNATKHSILAEEKLGDFLEEQGIEWWELYQIIKCNGCETLSFRKTSGSSDEMDFNTGNWIETVELYPERGATKNKIDDSIYFPAIISNMYEEMLSAFNKKLFLLATIGLRMLIEAVCIEEKIQGKIY